MTDVEDAPDGRHRWQQRYDRAAERARAAHRPLPDRRTLSGLPLHPVYGPGDSREADGRVGWPGEFPFTRGIHTTGYRGKPWTIRQFAGFGDAGDTNARFRALLDAGGHGLSVAFDMPTLMGRDSDDPLALGEVGHCGVAVDSVADLEQLFAGIPLGDVTT